MEVHELFSRASGIIGEATTKVARLAQVSRKVSFILEARCNSRSSRRLLLLRLAADDAFLGFSNVQVNGSWQAAYGRRSYVRRVLTYACGVGPVGPESETTFTSVHSSGHAGTNDFSTIPLPSALLLSS